MAGAGDVELERLRRNDVGTLRSLDLEHRAGRIGHDTSRDDTPGRHAGARTAMARHLGRHRRPPEPKGDRTLRLADKFCRITGGGSGIGCASALLFAGTSRRLGRSPSRSPGRSPARAGPFAGEGAAGRAVRRHRPGRGRSPARAGRGRSPEERFWYKSLVVQHTNGHGLLSGDRSTRRLSRFRSKVERRP